MSTHNICFYKKKKNQQKNQHKNIIQASFDEPLADFFSFYTLPHDSGGVLWFHIGCTSVPLSIHLS